MASLISDPLVGLNLRLDDALKYSVSVWQQHLKSAFRHAKDRFADVVLEVNESTSKDRDLTRTPVEIWVHKAILFARLPARYRNRYFPRKEGNEISPLPYATVSASVSPTYRDLVALDPEQFDPSHASCILRLTAPEFNTKSLTNLLRGLYAEKKKTEAEERDNHVSESTSAVKQPLTGFQWDLLYIWRTRLNCDVKITLHQEDPPVYTFWSHRFLLASRSPYFKSVLAESAILEKGSIASDVLLELELPTPLFTPPGFFFTLGYIYTGTLKFTKNTYDLETAFSIYKGSRYLNMPHLTLEIRARLVEEMMHGLFDAFTTDVDYEERVGGSWNSIRSTGCKCKQCSRRIPRILEFAVEKDFSDEFILRGARRAAIALFGEPWCTPEFGALSRSHKEYMWNGVKQSITVADVFPLLYRAEEALAKLETTENTFNNLQLIDVIVDVRQKLDEMLFVNSGNCFQTESWLQLKESYDSEDKMIQTRTQFEMGCVLKALNRCTDVEQARALYRALGQQIATLRQEKTDTSRPSSFCSKIEDLMKELSFTIIGPLSQGLSSFSNWYPIPQSELQIETNQANPAEHARESRSSPTSSIYSDISSQSSVCTAQDLDSSYHDYSLDLDVGNISLYSYPSSRTVSTDYGLFYTRRAISMDSIVTDNRDYE